MNRGSTVIVCIDCSFVVRFVVQLSNNGLEVRLNESSRGFYICFRPIERIKYTSLLQFQLITEGADEWDLIASHLGSAVVHNGE